MTRALGIDVGASGVRAAIVDATGVVVAYAAEPFAPEGGRLTAAAINESVRRAKLRGIARAPAPRLGAARVEFRLLANAHDDVSYVRQAVTRRDNRSRRSRHQSAAI